jgi:hypothetical protein
MQVNEHPVEQEEVMAYLDGELPSDRTAVVAEHMEECGDCQRLAAELRDVSRRLAAWQVERAVAWLPGKIGSALSGGRRLRAWEWSAGLATVFVLMALVLPKMMNQSSGAKVVAARLSAERATSVSKGRLPNVMPPDRPMIARTSQLTLTTKEFDKARGAVEDILKRHRGYLGQLDAIALPDSPRTLTAALRVPTDQLDPTTAEIKKLGQVESESQSGEDVTRQSVDLEARLTNARNTDQRLTALLHDRAGKMTDVLAVEKELDRVRGEIEQMEAEKKTLVNRVDFATLNVTMREASKAHLSPRSTWDRFRNAGANGYASLIGGIVGAVVFLLDYGPSLMLWGGMSFMILRLVFKRRRRLKFGP